MQINPSQFTDPQLQRIAALIQQVKIAEATPLLKAFLNTNPYNADAVFLTIFFLKDMQQQLKRCRDVLAINPSHTQARVLLTQLTGQKLTPTGA